MTTKLPTSTTLSLADHRRTAFAAVDTMQGGHSPGLWTGTREGLIATVIAVVAALVFGGAAGAWFAPGEAAGMGQMLRIASGTVFMASMVSFLGSLLAGRNPIFWGIGMPLLVYLAGSFCALISGLAGTSMFLFGAPLFCGLAVMAGVVTAFAVGRGR